MSHAARPGFFRGDLAAVGVVDLVQTLAHGRKTARLSLRSRSRRGEIWFREGELVHAAAGALFGQLAVFAMLEWARGDFRVDYDVTSPARSISEDATLVVLEGLRRIDERGALVEEPVATAPRSRRLAWACGLALAAGAVKLKLGRTQKLTD